MGHYSIKEVENLSGVKAHTLRIWEQRYDFLKPERTDTNIRYYTDEQLSLLLNIGTLNRHGVKISKISKLSQEEINKQVIGIYEESIEPNDLIDSMIHCMIGFDEYRFEKVLNGSILKMGFEQTFSKLILPFLVRVGVLWMTGAVRVAQEHFISSLIRRKLYVAIDGLSVSPDKRTKKFLLFLPEGETHELLLLFSDYLLRKHNHLVSYLGASLPFIELPFLAESFRPDYLVTYFTAPLYDNALQKYLKDLCALFPKACVIIGGAQIETLIKLPSPNCIAVHSYEDFVAAVTQ
jgi:DNA-binding transcriptional MerR regulator